MKKSIYETLLIEEFENARDLMLANERLSDKNIGFVSQKDFEKSFNINFDEIAPIDEDEFE